MLVLKGLICPTAYETLNHGIILCTMAETIPSLVFKVSIENENYPRMNSERDGKQNLNSEKANNENREINGLREL